MSDSVADSMMAQIIPFRRSIQAEPDDCEIDLLTAVDVAIRDLTDIAAAWGTESARQQAEECRLLLISAYEHALAFD